MPAWRGVPKFKESQTGYRIMQNKDVNSNQLTKDMMTAFVEY